MVFDIDILSNMDDIKVAVESIGGDWSKYKKNWKIINSNVTQKTPSLKPDEIKEKIIQIVQRSENNKLPKGDIESLLRADKPWKTVKKSGKPALPKGDCTKAFNALTADLEKIGIFIVPVGEIEGFTPEIGGKGPKHITNVLKTYSADAKELQSARRFVQSFFK